MVSAVRRMLVRLSRHSHVNNLIKRALESSAHVPTILELQGVSCSDGKRPDEMSIFSLRIGKRMVWTLYAVTPLPLVTLISHEIFMEKWQSRQN